MKLYQGLLGVVGVLIGGLTSCTEPKEAFSAEICLTLRHHGIVPNSATVYRAYGEQFPGYGADMDSRFFESAEMGPSGRVCFDKLNPGSHWFAAEGWDEFIADSVRGSKRMDVTTLQSSYEIELSVSEQH